MSSATHHRWSSICERSAKSSVSKSHRIDSCRGAGVRLLLHERSSAEIFNIDLVATRHDEVVDQFGSPFLPLKLDQAVTGRHGTGTGFQFHVAEAEPNRFADDVDLAQPQHITEH